MTRKGLGSYKLANRMVTQIEEICRRIIQEERPAPRYAVVESVEHERAYVRYPGDEESVPVPLTSVTPLPGQTVVIGGMKGDRHIVETVGRPLEGDTSTIFVSPLDVRAHDSYPTGQVMNVGGHVMRRMQNGLVTILEGTVAIPDAWSEFSMEILLFHWAAVNEPAGDANLLIQMADEPIRAGYPVYDVVFEGGQWVWYQNWGHGEGQGSASEVDTQFLARIQNPGRIHQFLAVNNVPLGGVRPFRITRIAWPSEDDDTWDADVYFVGVLLKRVK